jgi:hypothetical protein
MKELEPDATALLQLAASRAGGRSGAERAKPYILTQVDPVGHNIL